MANSRGGATLVCSRKKHQRTHGTLKTERIYCGMSFHGPEPAVSDARFHMKPLGCRKIKMLM